MRQSLLATLVLSLAACASEIRSRPAEMDPSNPQGPESPPLRASTAFASDQAAGGGGEGSPRPSGHDHVGTPPDAGGARQGGAAAYTCPMHPDIQRTEPGRCPECGMALVSTKASGTKPDEKGSGPDEHGGHGEGGHP